MWYQGILASNSKIGEGAEQKVYYDPHTGTVIKANESIFYSSWSDYLNNLKIHNYFFPNTAYQLLGFQMINSALYAIVEQLHVISSASVNLNDVKTFLENNGFANNKNNDYINKELGIILEDLHDENVLQNGVILSFIDTVFYLTDEFYKPITGY
ncbi:MAG TPA: hypothetical protein VIJ92_16580 [Ginsengibacter sp.]